MNGFIGLIEKQVVDSNYDEISDILAASSTRTFFEENDEWGKKLLEQLNKARYSQTTKLGVYQFDKNKLMALLNDWYETLQKQKAQTEVEIRINLLEPEISELFATLLKSQLQDTNYREFSELFKQESTQAFCLNYISVRSLLIDLLNDGSNRLAQAKRYSDARDFATLAEELIEQLSNSSILPTHTQDWLDDLHRELDRPAKLAALRKELAQKYLELLTSTEPDISRAIAQEIYNTDPEYGNIQKDWIKIKRDGYLGDKPIVAARLSETPQAWETQAIMAQVNAQQTPPMVPKVIRPSEPAKPTFLLRFIWVGMFGFGFMMLLAILLLVLLS